MRHIQFGIFVLALAFVFVLIHYYFWIRLFCDTGQKGSRRGRWFWILAVLGLSVPLALLLGRVLPFKVAHIALFIPYVWMGITMLMLAFLIGLDLVRMVLRLSNRIAKRDSPIEDPQRRAFFAKLIAGIAGGGVAVVGAQAVSRAMGDVALKRVDVVLSKLPRELNGFTIVQISDLHLGRILGGSWLEKVVNQVNDLKPDLVAITGDLADGSPGRLQKEIAPFTRLRSVHGTFFVTGNHEYYAGVEDWLGELSRLGIRVLRNERVSIEKGRASFDLAGIDDHSAHNQAPGHGPDLPRAVAGRNSSKELVLLAHQPVAVHEAAMHDVGLQLSGHTHGGQFWLLGYLSGLRQPYISGLHRHGKRTQIYVNQGTGFWGPPMRLGTENEITRIRLLSA